MTDWDCPSPCACSCIEAIHAENQELKRQIEELERRLNELLAISDNCPSR